ncbi:MAG: DUF4474 domain-containing protein [Clostridia bacterium]|nr:DUF4474 domain-containing protein [Clostridia bacterium]
MKKRIIAMLLVIITVFSAAAVPVGAAQEKKNKLDIIDIWQNGYPMFDIGAFLETIFVFNEQINAILGVKIFNEEKLVITTDNMISGIVEGVLNTTGVDFSKIYNNLPQSNQYAELLTSTLRLDIPETQKYLNSVSGDYFAEGNAVMGVVVRMVSVWLGIVDEVKLVTKQVEGSPNLHELGIEITYRDGRKDGSFSGIFYDSEENSFVGRNGEPALIGYHIDFDDNVIYTGINVWQRELGFNIFYDVFCYLTPAFFHYTTQRVKFNYDGKDWMLQLWKGRYAIANGGEVGVYTRDESKSGTFYDCASDEDMLVMSMDVYHGDDLLFSRPAALHWWVTGFQLSDTGYIPHSLTIVSTITMKDEEMLAAATEALDKIRNISYEVDGLDVTLTW